VILKEHRICVEGSKYVENLPAAQLSSDASHESDSSAKSPNATSDRFASTRLFQDRIHTLQNEKKALQDQAQKLETERFAALETAREEGRLVGVEEGRRQVEQELREAFLLLNRMEREFRRSASNYHADADKSLLELSTWMAEKVLAEELPMRGLDGLLKRIQALVDHWVGQSVYRFHLNPDERRLLLGTQALETLEERFKGRMEWVESPEIPPGGCRLELTTGLVDAVPSVMLDHLHQSLVEAIEAREEEDAS
jgi:flagellar biosynthesis/type III secretory pathway protein FliH